jgi:hypothetical protein
MVVSLHKEIKMSKSVKKSAAKSTKTAKKSAAKVAAPVAEKVAAKPVAEKSVAEKAPNPVIAACVALMLRPTGAGITDFQQVEGFNIPSMAVVRAAQRAGYEASASKKPGERTVYKAIPKS